MISRLTVECFVEGNLQKLHGIQEFLVVTWEFFFMGKIYFLKFSNE